MKVCLMIRLWNEEFFLPVLEQMIMRMDYVDGIIINEGRSKDKTLEVLCRWKETLFRNKHFEILFDQEEHEEYFKNEDEGYWYNRMIKRAESLGFDYAILLDADEIYSPSLNQWLSVFFKQQAFAKSIDTISFPRLLLLGSIFNHAYNIEGKELWEEKYRVMNIKKVTWRHPSEKGLHIVIYPFKKYNTTALTKMRKILKGKLFNKLLLKLFTRRIKIEELNSVRLDGNHPFLHLKRAFEGRRERQSAIYRGTTFNTDTFLKERTHLKLVPVTTDFIPDYLKEWYNEMIQLKETNPEEFYRRIK